MNPRHIKPRTVMLASMVMLAGTANAFSWNPADWLPKKSTTGSTTVAQTSTGTATALPSAPPIAPGTPPNYRAIVERYGPAVVGITTQGMMAASEDGLDVLLPDDPFFKFFRGLPGLGQRLPQDKVPVRGLGSGFIISPDGLILTNAHVVRNADEVLVKLSDRHEYKAKVLGSDATTDVAVLKINAGNLPVVSLGNPNALAVGDYVLAIGSPFGFEESATAGIVSAKGRSLPGDASVPFIQTDVAVNPGNSGGPLFDAQGGVIGINSQIYSRTGGYQGVSFAIPIDVALQVKDQIVRTGKVVHAQLGVTIQELNQSLSESFGLKQPDGALVSSVTADSAAAKAGIQPGDVILKYNNQPILRSGDLPALVGLGKPGDKATLQVWRDGKPRDLGVTLTESRSNQLAQAGRKQPAQKEKLGMALRALTPEEKQEANLASGLLVEQVTGAAANAGIEPGDIIVAVNGAPVKSVEQLQSLAAGARQPLALLVQRGDERIFVPVATG